MHLGACCWKRITVWAHTCHECITGILMSWSWFSGNISMQVEQVGIWTDDISAWNESMAAWTWCCSWSRSRSSKSRLCCMRAATHCILASLSSSVSAASLRWWLADRCSSLALLSSYVSMANLSCVVATIYSILSFLSNSFSSPRFIRLRVARRRFSWLSVSRSRLFLALSFSRLSFLCSSVSVKVFFLSMLKLL